jgi:hypothetical protein
MSDENIDVLYLFVLSFCILQKYIVSSQRIVRPRKWMELTSSFSIQNFMNVFNSLNTFMVKGKGTVLPVHN